MAGTKGFIYQGFKYSVYFLLLFNFIYFTWEAYRGSLTTHPNGLAWGDIIVVYSAAVDSAAWLVLLIVFELETYIIPDEKLEGGLHLMISAVNVVCSLLILYAFYGYVSTLAIPFGFEVFSSGVPPCDQIAQGASFLISLDEYVPLDQANCTQLVGEFYYNENLTMFGTQENLDLLWNLAWLDVLNAGVWILIVIVLQLEIYLESSRLFGSRFFVAYKYSKFLLYGFLVINTASWLLAGQFVDTWDATLWLLAFFFIEMNVLNWQEELAHEREVAAELSPLLEKV